MILILNKKNRDLIAVADTIAEARKVKREANCETVTEIVGAASYSLKGPK